MNATQTGYCWPWFRETVFSSLISPVVWLASRASDGQTDQRIVAREFASSPLA